MKITKRNGKELHQINIWPIIESITSSADQKALKSDNRLLTSKTGLARASIRNFLNNQVLDCYLQGKNRPCDKSYTLEFLKFEVFKILNFLEVCVIYKFILKLLKCS